MTYKGIRKNPASLAVFTIFLIAGVLGGIKVYAQTNIFEPGTTCRNPNDPRVAVICGITRQATPKTTETNYGSLTHPNPPAQGVTVCIYECDPNSPTCKRNGALVNLYSSTYSDQYGYYSIPLRKVGNKMVRYIAFMCGGKLANLAKIPSYTSFNYNVIVNCPDVSAPSTCPEALNPVDPGNRLSCDMRDPFSKIGDPPGPLEHQYEAKFSSNYSSLTEFNFWLEIQSADNRYSKMGESPLGILDNVNILGSDNPTPTKGAFYYKDCQMVYDYPTNIYCYRPDGTGAGATNSDTLDSYEAKLYYDPYFARMNFLPNIPIKNTLLFFKDLTARQDITNYAQNPTATASLLQTIFSNCKGNVYLRKTGQNNFETLPPCSDLKACNSAVSETSNIYRNRQYIAGSARNLANPGILLTEAQAYIDDRIKNIEVCMLGSEKIKIGDIQPPWIYCTPGNDDCPYRLDKTYWNPEFAYFQGPKGATLRIPKEVEPYNDSYWNPSPNTVNQVAFSRGREKAGIPIEGGTLISDNNYSQARNNGLYSAMAGIISNARATTQHKLNYVLERPYETLEDKAIYQQGVVKIEDAGSNILSHCENSNVNSQDYEVTSATETGVLVNSDFRGPTDHYFGPIIDLEARNKKTATSAIFVTSAAATRDQGLAQGSPSYAKYLDLYDSYLTMSQGKGRYNILDILTVTVNWFFNDGAGTKSKSFLDRVSDYPLDQGIEFRDDIKVSFPLSEQNWSSFFWHPTSFGPSDALFTGNIANLWGPGHACYPWNNVPAGKHCYESDTFGVSNTPSDIRDTCRVNECAQITLIKECECYVVYNNNTSSWEVRSDCGPTQERVTACTNRQISSCAVEKKDCKDGGWDRGCMGLVEPGTPSCPENPGSSLYWPRGIGEYANCPNGQVAEPYESCHVYLTETSGPEFGCDLSDAGPYSSACAADLEKDANLRITENTIRREIEDISIDETRIVNNEGVKKWAHPGLKTISWGNLAFESTNTSVYRIESGVTPNNEALNKNKDVKAIGGISPAYKMVSAHPLYANISSGGNPVSYHCASCTLLPVPNPEIIDLTTFTRDSTYESCKLSTTLDCEQAFGIYNLSPTFRLILNAAAATFEVPAASLITYLKVVWAPSKPEYRYLFSVGGEQALLEASTPWYGRIGTCDDLSWAAQGPYDWLLSSFNNVISSGDFISIINNISNGRGETLSRCNFFDATFAMAKTLSDMGPREDCGSWSWEDAFNGIATEAFGSERIGAYDDGRLAEYWNQMANLWARCK
ncbi:MAG: hypothetical protein KatS3mg101_0053 [Patescibacteria group bacterium]|nr:MAG: hypothetical protein KatS3mg101_0053 [Patescibacteria group bacterium]